MVQVWMFEDEEGLYLLTRHSKKFIAIVGDFPGDHYSIKKIASKKGNLIEGENEFHGSLNATMVKGKVYLALSSDKFAEKQFVISFAIEKLYDLYEFDPAYCLVPGERQRIEKELEKSDYEIEKRLRDKS